MTAGSWIELTQAHTEERTEPDPGSITLHQWAQAVCTTGTVPLTHRRSFIYSQQFVGSLSCGKILVKPTLHPLQCEKCEATKNKKPFMLWTYWSCSTSDQYKSGFRLWSIHVMTLTWRLIDLYWKCIWSTPAPQRSGPRERCDTVGMRCDFCIVSVFIHLVYCSSASQMNAAQWISFHWRRHIMCDIFLFLQC